MASRMTPLGLACKWLLLPAGLAALGYFLIGPRIGDGVLNKVQVPDTVRALLKGDPEPVAQASGGETKVTPAVAHTGGGPTVDVSVSSISVRAIPQDPPPRPRPKRRARPKVEEPKVETPPQETPPPVITEPPVQDVPPPTIDQGTTGGAVGDGDTSQPTSN